MRAHLPVSLTVCTRIERLVSLKTLRKNLIEFASDIGCAVIKNIVGQYKRLFQYCQLLFKVKNCGQLIILDGGWKQIGIRLVLLEVIHLNNRQIEYDNIRR